MELNGAPAILVWDAGKLIAAFMLEPRDGAIAEIYVMRNPDKLARLTAFTPA
ncbi:MAG: hypothetical protein O3B31_08745 [Chloroflexi bacterium]|nr:hypothetical protein [Chloroflexota bacterium]